MKKAEMIEEYFRIYKEEGNAELDYGFLEEWTEYKQRELEKASKKEVKENLEWMKNEVKK